VYECFNSRLVRLAAAGHDRYLTGFFRFNSRLVRLAVTNRQLKDLRKTKFQFQIGAIGRVGTDSLQVDLKVSIPDWCDWQLWRFVSEAAIASFNSRLVRLAERLRILIMRNYRPFQFQIGAIGSKRGRRPEF